LGELPNLALVTLKIKLRLANLQISINREWRLKNIVADPDPVPFLPLDPGSRMVKKSRSGSRMNIPDHITESLETIFWVEILKFFAADPDSESGIF
jgi:hypothetical protein